MAINPKQREFFNEHAETWDQGRDDDGPKINQIVEAFGIRPGDRILDVGTGTGVMIPWYESRIADGSVLAVDYSERMIEVAERKFPASEHPKVRFRVTDLYDLPERDEFDKVMCYSCFPHFPDHQRAVDVLTSTLRQGGVLMVAHSRSRAQINNIHREGGKVISNDFLPPVDVLKGMFQNAGLRVTLARDDDEFYLISGRRV